MKKNGKYCSKKGMNMKPLAVLLALTLLVGCAVGGTLAWLLDTSNDVANTFTTSDVGVELTETKTNFQMVPGHYIEKDPKVTVAANSEASWLFVKIVESATLDDYIAYALPETGEGKDWQVVDDGDNNEDTIVIARKVTKSTSPQDFTILQAGSYTHTASNTTISWAENQVGVKPEVTKEMMAALSASNAVQPKLTFTAYVTQLYKNNNTEFTAVDAWNLAKDNPANPVTP